MKRPIRNLALLLCILMLLPMGLTARAAYAPKHTAEADILYDLGLFKGTGVDRNGKPIYALEQKATRMQGLVMLIRLLGEEADALAFTGPCPFTDVPAWAQPYATYAYAKGYTKGTSATTFGADDPLLGKAYITFVLRALGHDDAAGDFSYDTSLTFGTQLGLLETGQYTADLYRDDCAAISHTALRTNMKSGNGTLADKLIDANVLTKADVQASGLYNSTADVPITYTDGALEIRAADLHAAFPTAEYIDNGGFGGVSLAEYSKMHITALSALMSSGKAAGKESAPSITSMLPNGTFRFTYNGGSNLVFLALLDQNLRLVGYFVIPPAFSAANATTLPFIVCGEPLGKEAIDTAIKGVKTISSPVPYSEKIITQMPDGTETSVSYLRIDKSKLPADIQNFTHYCISHGGDKDAIRRFYATGGRNVKTYGVDPDISSQFGGSTYLYFIGANHQLLATCKLPNELKIVETIIQK